MSELSYSLHHGGVCKNVQVRESDQLCLLLGKLKLKEQLSESGGHVV